MSDGPDIDVLKQKEVLLRSCRECRQLMRLVGLEANSHEGGADIATYECGGCGGVEIASLPRPAQQIFTTVLTAKE